MSDYYPFAPKEQERELCRSEARRCFSRVGWACCAMMLAAQLGAVLLTFGCQLLAMRGSRVMIAFIQSDWFQWVMTDAANYGLGLPLMLWVLHGGARPAALPRRRVTARQFGALVPVCFTVMYLSNLIGLGVNAAISALRGEQAGEPLQEMLAGGNPWIIFLFAVVIAPAAEEWVFRGVLRRRLAPGDS